MTYEQALRPGTRISVEDAEVLLAQIQADQDRRYISAEAASQYRRVLQSRTISKTRPL